MSGKVLGPYGTMDPLAWDTRRRLSDDPEHHDIVGIVGLFFGAHTNCFKIGDLVFEAVEDPDDGYRSMLDEVRLVETPFGFFSQPLDEIEVVSVEDSVFLGYELRSTRDGHVWLRVGTDEINSYYPMFIFEYRPREGR